MKILLIIPAYNEESNILKLLKEIKSQCDSRLDILVVNDHSSDNTSSIAKQANVNVIDLPCNLGIGGAVQTGYKYAYKNGYDIAIQIDGDGQHSPKYINTLVEPIIKHNADFVIGSRYIQKVGFQSTFLRRLGINYFSLLIKFLCKRRIKDTTSGYRAANKTVIKAFAENYPSDYPEPESIVFLLRKKLRVLEVPVVMKEREGGVSSITSYKSVYYIIKVSVAILIDMLRSRTVQR